MYFYFLFIFLFFKFLGSSWVVERQSIWGLRHGTFLAWKHYRTAENTQLEEVAQQVNMCDVVKQNEKWVICQDMK